MAQVPLRIPQELHADIKEMAEEQGVSMNQFLLYAVTSKVAEMKKSRDYFQARTAGRTRQEASQSMQSFLAQVPVDGALEQGDELP